MCVCVSVWVHMRMEDMFVNEHGSQKRVLGVLFHCSMPVSLRKFLFLNLGLEPLMGQQVPGNHPVSVWL